MYRTLLAALLLTIISPLLAAPTATDFWSPPPLNADEAKAFAQSLMRTSDEVYTRYVRKVSSSDLLFAALCGLYEAARRPVPDQLKAELAKIAKEPQEGIQPADGRILDPATFALVARVRESLGDPEVLRKGNDLRVAVQAMARSLDPYCAVVSGDELRRGNGENINAGYGFEVRGEGAASVLVEKVLPGSPAQRAGIRPGDRITHLDGKPAELNSVLITLAGILVNGDETHRKIELTVERLGKKPRKVALTSAFFKAELVLGVQREPDESWNYWLDADKKIGYARIGSLEHECADDLDAVLVALKADGMKGFVLDLRWSPGGFLNEAILLARMFLKEGAIATIKSRDQDDVPYNAQGDGRLSDFPLVVLVNGETSGGAELIVAALQDNKRATIVGQRTFGKASVQTILALPMPSTGLKLTSGSFLRPSGKTLHRFPDSKLSDDWGVQPESACRLPITPDLSRRLRDWYMLQALRPGSSDEPLPLDDPENDPQRQMAAKVLAQMIR